jgi:hypothetical protein
MVASAQPARASPELVCESCAGNAPEKVRQELPFAFSACLILSHYHLDPRCGNVMQAKLVRQPKPIYSLHAKQPGIFGAVRLNAIIGLDGTIRNLTFASGDPELAHAAMEAVRQWV